MKPNLIPWPPPRASHVVQAQILRESAGLLQGSRSSVVRASTAKVGGLGFDSQWLPFPSVCFYPNLLPVAYHQFLPPCSC